MPVYIGLVPVHTRSMQDHPSWRYVEYELAKLLAKPLWPELVLREIYKVSTEPLEKPNVAHREDLFRSATKFREWFKTNRRREQMRKEFPKPASSPCRKLDGPVAGSMHDGWLACGWRGGRCCRRISCPLNDCRLPWTAHSAADVTMTDQSGDM
jgi:hypothetical protein